jgi:transposase InsO family protein
MVKTTIIRETFSKIAIDIVGPLSRTKKGNKYILTVIDEGTRYPEAFPLPSIEAERIAQSLVQLFSRVGVARVILSDQGSNFTSTLLKQLYEMLGVKGITTSPHIPQSNGKCERYNGTLKKRIGTKCCHMHCLLIDRRHMRRHDFLRLNCYLGGQFLLNGSLMIGVFTIGTLTLSLFDVL